MLAPITPGGPELRRSLVSAALAVFLGIVSSTSALAASGITEYPMPNGAPGAQYITTGPDGNLWVTDTFHNTIVKMAPSGSTLASYTIPTAGSQPYGITAGPDGNLWFVHNA